MLAPGMKPISMAPYYASPAKREVIDKQLDLWLSQGVIEESKSPWGAPIIIVYRNGKLRVCTLSGFTQMEFDKESRPIMAIRTHCGLHDFKRMPFGW